ncbi:MAG TPA: alpha amylase C-terminal domain-containing protein [Candidatus Blautia pullistercoris]|uniref:Alpha amylase C-terminal domain-containing protein n=1 Tax=Candidatus Blautia pullistercoris TaxID=2838499 RepID=A0A9D2AM25_9FIRM|nr:alpha amylase C-terminal domain-containing protein [Candidatus Blautia pullistercoris]
MYAFLRKSDKEEILTVLNFNSIDLHNYEIQLPKHKHAVLLLDSNSKLFGGPGTNHYTFKNGSLELQIGHFSGQYFLLK